MGYDENLIFVTDDDEDDRDFLVNALTDCGYAGGIVQSNNGLELIDQLNETGNGGFRIVVLDLNMPIMNGYTALKNIKTSTDLKGIPVIILSATSKVEDKTECLRLGCADFIEKPMAFDEYKLIAAQILGNMQLLNSAFTI